MTQREMEYIDRNRCTKVIQCVLEAYQNFKESTVAELLAPTAYGKGDTLAFDASPEIFLNRSLERFDSDSIFLTEEIGRTKVIRFSHSIEDQPLVLISDPVDRSAFLKTFLEEEVEQKQDTKFKEVIARSDCAERWEDRCKGGAAMIGGPTLAITAIKKGSPLFSVILNYLTQDLFVASKAGKSHFSLNDISAREIGDITLERVISQGEPIKFRKKRQYPFDDFKNYYTFLGKKKYEQHFKDAKIFSQDSLSSENLIYDEPGGPTRILYLSSLCSEPVGFIVANGEKIIEWIHWLPYLCLQEQGEVPLRVFLVYFDRPYMKKGFLMSPSPAYSIFRQSGKKGEGSYLIDLNKLRDHDNPSLYRSMLVIAPVENPWVSPRMIESEYLEIEFRF